LKLKADSKNVLRGVLLLGRNRSAKSDQVASAAYDLFGHKAQKTVTSARSFHQ
jgi:hypothetical protein